MVHLLALPGAPAFAGSIDEVVTTALDDARLLVDAGFGALIVENFGDVPFYADRVPPETVAAMTMAAKSVAEAGVPFGINVLRNDALGALGVAAATGARFIRVNVLTGVMYTDQGPIVGRAAEVQRQRSVLAPDVEIWADVMVKHSVPPPGIETSQAALDTIERGLADAVILSGSGTGTEIEVDEARAVRAALGESARIVIGSGARADNLDRWLPFADTVIVGSSVKFDGDARNRPDPIRAKLFVEKATEKGLV